MRRERTEGKIEETSSSLALFLSDSIEIRSISCIVFDRFVFERLSSLERTLRHVEAKLVLSDHCLFFLAAR